MGTKGESGMGSFWTWGRGSKAPAPIEGQVLRICSGKCDRVNREERRERKGKEQRKFERGTPLICAVMPRRSTVVRNSFFCILWLNELPDKRSMLDHSMVPLAVVDNFCIRSSFRALSAVKCPASIPTAYGGFTQSSPS